MFITKCFYYLFFSQQLIYFTWIHPDQEDYRAVSVDLIFSESVRRSCVRIPIQNDSRVEDPEEFTVTLNSTNPDVMPGPPSTITIVDDDGEDKYIVVQKEMSKFIHIIFYRSHYWF